MKNAFWLLALGWAALIWGAVIHRRAELEYKLVQDCLMLERGRSSLLQDELAELARKPTYEQGYRDAVIRAGTPDSPGSYKDGYYAGFLAAGDGGYSDGYHAAIEQFGHKEHPRAKLPVVAKVGGDK
jgi:hypothetical protein